MWTQQATNRLGELVDRGLSASRIACALAAEGYIGLTRCSISGKVWRMGKKLTGGPGGGSHRGRKARSRPFQPSALEVEPIPMVPVADSEIPLGQRRTLIELTNVTCRFPIGETTDPDFFYCGHPSADLTKGRAYCAVHHNRAFQPLRAR